MSFNKQIANPMDLQTMRRITKNLLSEFSNPITGNCFASKKFDLAFDLIIGWL